jgi:hypothetical protein
MKKIQVRISMQELTSVIFQPAIQFVNWQLDLLEGKKFMTDRGAKKSASNVNSPL